MFEETGCDFEAYLGFRQVKKDYNTYIGDCLEECSSSISRSLSMLVLALVIGLLA